ncbi:MAG TPA: ZIP family metal transporter [Vicinamibacterales bacterium]|nr:ZIP family metal transporter [Vicinamibacterales bacterium]
MQSYTVAVGLSVLGSLGGLMVASLFLLIGDTLRVRLVPWAISYAVGTLLGVALLALLPQSLEFLPAGVALGTLLAGVLAFFVLEKLVLWRHCHDAHECEVHTSSAASLVIVGDALHTFVDGAVIAAAVMISIPLGITTALAVAAHEIPQEVGDVAILLRAGYSRGKALMLNLVAGIGGILGAVAMLAASQWIPNLLPYVLAFAAGNFLYIAMADLIPDLHRGGVGGGPMRQLLLIGAGIGTIVLL